MPRSSRLISHFIHTHPFLYTAVASNQVHRRYFGNPFVTIMATTNATTGAAPSPVHKETQPLWSPDQTQEQFMQSDAVILVSPTDTITGYASKYAAHRFDTDTEGNNQHLGMLHRAFSVFLFDKDNRLLLQQRAASKITFDSVWTNTCCSHPLGTIPSEVDDVDEVVASGKAPGAARAAVRKLSHELGIEGIDADAFTFLTRLHYCARDERHPEWGEHEMDYILFHRLGVRGEALPVAPHPEEVGGVRWVTREELGEMMEEGNGLKWSPWFRLIARDLLGGWWEEMDEALRVNGKFVDGKIHRIMS